MRKLILSLDNFVEVVAKLFGYIAAVSAVVMTVVVTYGVVMRAGLNRPQIWTDQIASYSMLWMVFFGLAYTLSSGTHIRVDFFTQLLPVRGTREREIVVWAIGLLFSVLFFLGCYTLVENFIRRGTHSTVGFIIPLYWPALPMLIGAGLFSLMMLARLVRISVLGLNPASSDSQDT